MDDVHTLLSTTKRTTQRPLRSITKVRGGHPAT
jgi:hypothetical protein